MIVRDKRNEDWGQNLLLHSVTSVVSEIFDAKKMLLLWPKFLLHSCQDEVELLDSQKRALSRYFLAGFCFLQSA